MDQVVQQNASLVEEATAATESMKEQAGALLQSVARFNLGDRERMAYDDVHAAPARQQPHAGGSRPARGWPERPAHLPGATVTALGAPQSPAAPAGQWQEF
jgi:methyl-accepting chemotaxis protein